MTSLDLDGDISIENGNSILIATTDQAILVPYTGPEFQSYSDKNAPCNYWCRLPLSDRFFFCELSKYLRNPSFIISLWFPLTKEFTGMSKVSWICFLKIPENSPPASTIIIFGRPNGTKNLPKSHHTTWYDVISLNTLADSRPNPVIKKAC